MTSEQRLRLNELLAASLSERGLRLATTITEGPHRGERLLGLEEDLARQLVQSLTADQLAVALVSKEAPRNVLSGWSQQATDSGRKKFYWCPSASNFNH